MQRELEPEVMDSPEEAAAYDAMDHREPNAAFVERLLELGAADHADPMLDIGTGNGLIPILLAERLPEAKIVGVDLSRHMLKLARRHLERSAVDEDRVLFKLGRAQELAFEPATFECVFSNTILHHLPDPEPMLREAWRVLKPGGVLLIRDLFRPPDDAAVEHLVEQHAAEADERGRQLLRQSLKAAFTPDELRAIVARLGWPDVEVVVDTDRHVSLQCRSQ